ncbi:hypothetical protein [Nannocystis punicea]|uniref:Uncharacterized protein n=1 Tax=Nannocystis punicea TaxID=2995304 RepID=A0ABY7H8V2_9BACT|nr:hypothetical protein [Nannocystis poenicansa]WAS95537.1 hypothetical protein O0S08_05190 [Nannocystis poenicansa]
MHGGHQRIDVEWLALAAGLKPAIRIAATALEASAIAGRFQALGAAVVTARGPVGVHRHEHTLVYVARDPADAAAVRAAERPLLASHLPPKDKAYYAGELGRRLGYPRCCVDAFTARILRGPGKLRAGDRDSVHEDYVAAHDASVAKPDWRLNNLLLRQHLRLVTFEPCRYDCGLAVAFAAEVLRLCQASDAPSAHVLTDRLQRPLVLTAAGARAWVRLERGASPRVVAAEAPRAGDPAARPDRDDEVLAARLPRVALADLGDPPPLLLDFSA